MILISQARAGSDWFLQGLTIPWNGAELLSTTDMAPNNPYTGLSEAAKIKMLRAHPKNKAQKIITWDVTAKTSNGTFAPDDVAQLMRTLSRRDDLYLLSRRNVRAMVISYILAMHNQNFHGPAPLTAKFTLSYKEFFMTYRGIHSDFALFENAFKYQEKFVYEDLLSGAQVPQTLDWNPARAHIKRRHSLKSAGTITNYDELIGWMDDLNVPGDVTEGLTSP